MRSPFAPMMARHLLTVLLSAGVPGIAAAADASGVAHGGSSDINGADVYSQICQGCHMPNAQGAVGAGMYPALAKNPKLEVAGYPIAVVVKLASQMEPQWAPLWLQAALPVL